MKKLHPAAAAMTIAVLLAGVLRHSGYSTYGPIDTAILVVFLVFFWWLISDFSGGKAAIDADDGRSADNGMAFRFGRFLSRVFRRGQS
ncbi:MULTISPECIES: hypothetical protein [unclassified Mesorhizobium]|jgi:hypothetical protein|uniref:hypothetical protein n=1 Tax=unclassified Mesorhizobium TaxID=325217 RepID=UPI0011260451|nr:MULTISPECIES: hypothetical protein [unclassified Mesorhizobium]MBZ9895368.1 hypothetical protein [Mesorhizobium sp. BR1-1-6]MCA0024394.1 hypothetical protein [Mesorhizobium sp. B263B1A]TPI52411.1 hypothetical protein FJW11_16980 [Mesorhizobium sp. B3-1-1]TPJ51618.1 hypothetical protein FJ426_20515 [Mesorhizobium sp. B2-6-4]TPJ62322.1 hypothetical protein FJ443_14790 [Mesorhizobium sp. B2-6-1]